jgi:hypothetical protein
MTEPGDPRSSPLSTAPGEPEVRITIGRVEVRPHAPAAPAPAPEPPWTPPRLSLDDYLARSARP